MYKKTSVINEHLTYILLISPFSSLAVYLQTDCCVSCEIIQLPQCSTLPLGVRGLPLHCHPDSRRLFKLAITNTCSPTSNSTDVYTLHSINKFQLPMNVDDGHVFLQCGTPTVHCFIQTDITHCHLFSHSS